MIIGDVWLALSAMPEFGPIVASVLIHMVVLTLEAPSISTTRRGLTPTICPAGGKGINVLAGRVTWRDVGLLNHPNESIGLKVSKLMTLRRSAAPGQWFPRYT
jgi:hypothetical protein